ncbi:hypothetical protein J6590_086497 [Homalodisca vitripennis]|nr:hypothetical protein J6590_086497 [Homalodisca vitripennis]
MIIEYFFPYCDGSHGFTNSDSEEAFFDHHFEFMCMNLAMCFVGMSILSILPTSCPRQIWRQIWLPSLQTAQSDPNTWRDVTPHTEHVWVWHVATRLARCART